MLSCLLILILSLSAVNGLGTEDLALNILPSNSELLSAASNKTVDRVISSYSWTRGFEVETVSSLALGIVKLAAKSDSDPDTKEFARAIDKLNKIVTVQYEDAAEQKRNEFDSDIKQALESHELLIEEKDEEGKWTYIYGKSNDNKPGVVKDVIVYCPEDKVLMCLYGELNLTDLALVTEEHTNDK